MKVFQTVLIFLLMVCIHPILGDLVSLWKGENNANDSIAGRNGTIYNGMTYAAGKVGNAFSFNGSNYITVANNAAFRPSNFTIVSWIKANSLSPNTWNTVFAYGASGSDPIAGSSWDSYYFGFYNGYARLHTLHSFGDLNITSNVAVTLNQWHMLSATFNGTTSRLYLDGVEVASGTANAPLHYDTNVTSLVMGEDWNNNQPASIKFNGLVDELAFYNNALTSQDMQTLFNAGVSVIPEPMNLMLFLLASIFLRWRKS